MIGDGGKEWDKGRGDILDPRTWADVDGSRRTVQVLQLGSRWWWPTIFLVCDFVVHIYIY
jgi:hypothetical protein